MNFEEEFSNQLAQDDIGINVNNQLIYNKDQFNSNSKGPRARSSKRHVKKKILEFNSKSGHAISLEELYGDLEQEDKPLKIKATRIKGLDIEFIVEWRIRNNGYKPKDSVVTSREFRAYDPEFLIDYYESNLKTN